MTCSGLEPGPGHKPWQQTALTTDKSTLEDNLYLSTKDAFSAVCKHTGPIFDADLTSFDRSQLTWLRPLQDKPNTAESEIPAVTASLNNQLILQPWLSG
jgi:hypothetical protein